MDKPKTKALFILRWHDPDKRKLGFDCASSSAVELLTEFGDIVFWPDTEKRGTLVVNDCYKFGEVLRYIKSLSKEKPDKKKKVDRRYATGAAASVCFSCRWLECPYRWDAKMNINTQGFVMCPFRERLDT